MLFTLLVLAILQAVGTATPLHSLEPREDRVPCPGPIPIPETRGWGVRPLVDSVQFGQDEGGLGLDAKTQDTFRKCLVDYGSGMFMNGWQGNVCGGLGWFKGTKNTEIDPYWCYQVCAPYLRDNAALGAKKMECKFRRGWGKGKECWMGYHPFAYTSTQLTYPEYAATPIGPNGTAARTQANTCPGDPVPEDTAQGDAPSVATE
ncbi:MAG: hypothetical protein Q9183_003641 [Haloplaca sp. 2 TL-2023]